MNSAFTYGKKIKYEDLADPKYVEKLLKYMRKYQSPLTTAEQGDLTPTKRQWLTERQHHHGAGTAGMALNKVQCSRPNARKKSEKGLNSAQTAGKRMTRAAANKQLLDLESALLKSDHDLGEVDS